ncbi:MAG: glycosyltransferase family 39 protein [Pseudolabrys sp.]|nr:glycosyltransferase family 39 protein [Pseudolabrys sp.]
MTTQALTRSLARVPADERATLILLALFVMAWTIFHTIVFSPFGLHPDLTEVYDWGRHPALGYYKHPPLSGWICGLWFLVFPASDWAFQLLAMVNAAAGLFVADRIARRYLPADKRLMALLLLLLTPFYQFIAQKFNVNAVLLWSWPLAVYCFLRAFETRALTWSIAAGAACALAMLGKYYSIYLVAGIVIGALTHPKTTRYLASPSPWISAITGIVVLAPHVWWLVETGYQPFTYAYIVHGTTGLGAVLLSLPGYLAGAIGYVALPTVLVLLLARPNRQQIAETLWPCDAELRMLAIMQGAFLLLPALWTPLFGIELTSLWSMQSWFLLPTLLLAPASTRLPRHAGKRLAIGIAIFTAVALLASPVLAWINFSRPSKDDRGYSRQLAEDVTRQWQELTGKPLSIAIGDNNLAASVEFYGASHPDSVAFLDLKTAPWVTAERMRKEGWAGVCNAANANCIAGVSDFVAGNPRVARHNIEITPTLFGYRAPPATFAVILVPPQP